MEEALKLKYDSEKEEIRRYVTELEGESLQRKSHRIEGIVVEEENENEEETERVSVLVGTEAEEIIQSDNYYQRCDKPQDVEALEERGLNL